MLPQKTIRCQWEILVLVSELFCRMASFATKLASVKTGSPGGIRSLYTAEISLKNSLNIKPIPMDVSGIGLIPPTSAQRALEKVCGV
jgi:hypothetical protein